MPPMYPGDPTKEVKKKIFEALFASAPLAALVGTRIYDHAKDNSDYPYLKFSADFKNHGSHTTQGFDGEITFQAFITSRQNTGSLQADLILEEVFKIFERRGIIITDLGMVACERIFQRTFLEPGGFEVFQGISRYRLIMGG